MSTTDGLAFIDKTIANAAEWPIAWSADDVRSFLAEVRVHVADAERALSVAREALLHEHISSEIAALLFETTIADLRRQVASARRWAVELEQDAGRVVTARAVAGHWKSALLDMLDIAPQLAAGTHALSCVESALIGAARPADMGMTAAELVAARERVEVA